MTWLITGGSGQLGTAISETLHSRGVLFKAWDSKVLNITQASIVQEAINALEPKVIVNCAAWTDVDAAEVNEQRAFRVNSDGAENIAIAARFCGAKLIHISTDYVFSGEGSKPLNATDERSPKSVYGRTKADGELRVLAAYPQNTSIVRTAWLYSSKGKNFAKTMTELALQSDTEVKVVNDQIGQPTSAADLALQILELGISNSPAGIYHGTNSGEASWFEFACEVFKLTRSDILRIVPVSTRDNSRQVKRPSYSVLNHDSWSQTSLSPMRDWKSALSEAMPEIISSIQRKG
jgi:dTDP-4-dehydrorhamnose reductase